MSSGVQFPTGEYASKHGAEWTPCPLELLAAVLTKLCVQYPACRQGKLISTDPPPAAGQSCCLLDVDRFDLDGVAGQRAGYLRGNGLLLGCILRTIGAVLQSIRRLRISGSIQFYRLAVSEDQGKARTCRGWRAFGTRFLV